MTDVAGLVLAAGSGSRFGQPKAPFVMDGERFVDRAVRNLSRAGCDPIVVVLGAWIGTVPGADVVINDAWEEGMGSSLRAGLVALEMTDAQAVVITLVDLPGLTPEAVRRLVDSSADVAVATYRGERGHPVRVARQHWHEVIDVAVGDKGARDFLRRQSQVDLIEVGDVAEGQDVDTVDDV